MKEITVLLADDHQIVRSGLRSVLELQDDIDVIGQADNGREAVALVRKLLPDVALIDITMPFLNGIETTRQIRKTAPQVKVVILTAHDDEGYVISSARAGAAGFLHKHTSVENICQAIREAKRGGPFFRTHLLTPFGTPALSLAVQTHGKRNRLSSREVEVLQLIAEGKSNKQAGAELGLSFKTVDKHRQHLMCKLDLHNKADLTRYALAEGLIECHLAKAV